MRVLVVDDEKNIRASIAELCTSEGMDAVEAANGLSAQKALSESAFDVAVVDLRMPGMDGIALLEWLRDEGPQVSSLVVSAHGEVEDAVKAMKLGAVDYLVKPFDPDELLLRIRRAGEQIAARRRVTLAGRATSYAETNSPTMKSLYKLAARVAGADSTVLITGETGTGKEVMARYVHDHSPRSNGPFVPINIGGVPEQLLESELFGYERGAFTGADRRKEGLFELASGGTLFLDEIGEMPMHLQVKLLRVIQERSFQRLGGTGTIPIDARLIAATNRDLAERVADGEFREDLFYRLNVIHLALPPLRERREDIPLLATHVIGTLRERTASQVTSIGSDALEALSAYSFPGNVRELENLIERAMILADGDTICARDFPFALQEGKPRKTGTLRDLEREAIIAALHRHEGHRTNAAAELGITRRTLLNKIKEYGLAEDSY